MLQKGNKEFTFQSRWDRSLISVGPKCYEREADSLHSNLGGTDRSSGGTKTLQRETERLQSHLGETEIPIGETDLPRVCGSG